MSMQEQELRRIFPRMLFTITREETEPHLREVFRRLEIPVEFQIRAHGTAHSELLDALGLSGSTRIITIGILPKVLVPSAFDALNRECNFYQRGAGIAFTLPVLSTQNHLLEMLGEETQHVIDKARKGEETAMKHEYSLIWVAVESGYSDAVVDAAREAGAQGGTIIKGRRRNSERATQFFGISIQEEQDFVMIVTPTAKKPEISAAIAAKCGIKTPAHGLLLSLPVDEVLGLESAEPEA